MLPAEYKTRFFAHGANNESVLAIDQYLQSIGTYSRSVLINDPYLQQYSP